MNRKQLMYALASFQGTKWEDALVVVGSGLQENPELRRMRPTLDYRTVSGESAIISLGWKEEMMNRKHEWKPGGEPPTPNLPDSTDEYRFFRIAERHGEHFGLAYKVAGKAFFCMIFDYPNWVVIEEEEDDDDVMGFDYSDFKALLTEENLL